jgi:hypothetical protein
MLYTMVRTMLSLDPSQHRRAKRKAAELGISLSAYMRRLVDADLGTDDRRKAHIGEIFDLGRGPGTDIAGDKDRMIGEAVVAGRGRDAAG